MDIIVYLISTYVVGFAICAMLYRGVADNDFFATDVHKVQKF